MAHNTPFAYQGKKTKPPERDHTRDPEWEAELQRAGAVNRALAQSTGVRQDVTARFRRDEPLTATQRLFVAKKLDRCFRSMVRLERESEAEGAKREARTRRTRDPFLRDLVADFHAAVASWAPLESHPWLDDLVGLPELHDQVLKKRDAWRRANPHLAGDRAIAFALDAETFYRFQAAMPLPRSLSDEILLADGLSAALATSKRQLAAPGRKRGPRRTRAEILRAHGQDPNLWRRKNA